VDEIPNHQKVVDKAGLLDHLHLVRHAREHFAVVVVARMGGVGNAIALLQPPGA